MNREPRKPIRICHISTVHRPDDVRIFVRECCSLADAGYAVHLVIAAPDAQVKRGVHIHPIRVPRHRLLRMLLGPWIALRAALKTKARLCHYHDPELIGLGFVLRWLLGKKVVFDIHECVWRQLESKPYLPRWAGWLLGRVYRGLEGVVTFGQIKVVANATSMSDYPHGVLVQNFPKRVAEIIPTQRTFDRARTPRLVYLGVVAEIRGVHVYIELARRLKERGRACRLVLIGEHTEALAQLQGS